METTTLPHLPQHPLHVCLFRDVQNAAFLRQQLLDGNTRFEYAFLDAAVLLSTHHVWSACFRAVNDLLNARLKTRNVHAEIVFALSPNNNNPFADSDSKMTARISWLSKSAEIEQRSKHIFSNTSTARRKHSPTTISHQLAMPHGFGKPTDWMRPEKVKLRLG